MIYLALIVIAVSWKTGATVGLLALLLAFDLLLQVADINLVHEIWLLLLLLAVPGGSLLTLALCSKFCEDGLRSTSLRALAVAAPLALLLSSSQFYDYLTLAVTAVADKDVRLMLPGSLAVINAAVFCGGLAAIAVISIHLAAELPVRWFMRAGTARVDLAFRALRPLTIVLLVALFLDYIIALYSREFWPKELLGG